MFKDSKGLPDWATNDQVAVINSYDNAVRYNDFVMSTLIKNLSAAKTQSLLVYFLITVRMFSLTLPGMPC